MSENGEIYTADKNFTLPPAVAAGTNLNSAFQLPVLHPTKEGQFPRDQFFFGQTPHPLERPFQVPTGSQIYMKNETGQTSTIPVLCLI